MAALTNSALAWITARAGVGRAGAIRAGAAPKIYELKANGQIIWNRDVPNLGEPDDTVASWTTGRE